jgi:hypothetical protein
MNPSHFVRFLVSLLVLVLSGHAKAQDAPEGNPYTSGDGANGEIEKRGMDCVPQVREVETRRAIPIQCQTDYEVAGVELRYKPTSGKWAKVELENTNGTWTGMIPCSATNKRGTLSVYVFARNDANKVVARVGRSTSPMTVRIVEQSKAPAPAFPNKEPPARCFEKTECPPEMLGTAACPGTKANPSVKRAWGASCTESSQCQDNLECLSGSCETPAKCETAKDCPDGSECSEGFCHTPTAEELASRLGPPKHHWIGLHAGMDFLFMRESDGVCQPDGHPGQSEDSKRFACYQAGNAYGGIPNTGQSGHLSSGMYVGTIRALLSYEYAFKRFLVGGRLGWAFRGAPKNFSPIHAEARGFYSLRSDVFNKNFRPYLGLAAGYAQVDASGSVRIVDCTDRTMVNECRDATRATVNQFLPPSSTAATSRDLNAFRSGTRFFFGPTLHMVFAIANDSAIVLNIMAMFPDVVIEPTLGYELAL